MTLGIKELMAAAETEITSVSGDEAQALMHSDAHQFLDIRDVRELERDGLIPGARHAPRGMLEFWIDPESPYHKPWLAEDKTFILYCASGWRSLLSAQIAQKMGLKCVSLRGGFGEWKSSGRPVALKDSR